MTAVVRASGLTKVFGSGESQVVAVQGVDLAVTGGELVLIMGPSGSGKTTLLAMLGGLLRPTAGTVAIGSSELTALSERQLTAVRRRDVGFIFQSFNLLETLSVRENVEIVLNLAGAGGTQAVAAAEAALRQLGLANRMNFGARSLSGGEKQRVSIARALVHNPIVLLADEPTANLDSKNGRAVMQLLRELAADQGRAVIVVSHDERIRSVATRVLWLEDGALVPMGRLETDPVCRMQVDASHATTEVFNGNTLFFCSAGCRAEFLADPAAFASPG